MIGIVEYAEKCFDIKLTDAQKTILKYVEEHPDAKFNYIDRKSQIDTQLKYLISSYKDVLNWDQVVKEVDNE